MRFTQLIKCLEGQPVFVVADLAWAQGLDLTRLREQLSRWQERGLVQRVGRGVYCLTADAGVRDMLVEEIAAAIMPDSAVSMESALSWRGVETLRTRSELTCVTQHRTRHVRTPFGAIHYRYMDPALWWGYEMMDLPSGSRVRMATPEKALLDILHYVPYRDHAYVLERLDIRCCDRIDIDELAEGAKRMGLRKGSKPGSQAIRRTVASLESYWRRDVERSSRAGTGPPVWEVVAQREMRRIR
jgi:predicted transcriptional regulator of viral defense system